MQQTMVASLSVGGNQELHVILEGVVLSFMPCGFVRDAAEPIDTSIQPALIPTLASTFATVPLNLRSETDRAENAPCRLE